MSRKTGWYLFTTARDIDSNNDFLAAFKQYKFNDSTGNTYTYEFHSKVYKLAKSTTDSDEHKEPIVEGTSLTSDSWEEVDLVNGTFEANTAYWILVKSATLKTVTTNSVQTFIDNNKQTVLDLFSDISGTPVVESTGVTLNGGNYELTIQVDVDYNSLDNDQKNTIESNMKALVANEYGIDESNITITITAGSTVIKVTFSDPSAASEPASEPEPAPEPDLTTPTLTSVSIASSNNKNTYAKANDEVTLTFTASETINTPTVTFTSNNEDINNTNITYTNTTGNTWTAAYTVNANDGEGLVKFSISFSDTAGNNGANVTGTTDVTSVTIDRTPPVITINNNPLNLELDQTYADPHPDVFATDSVDGGITGDALVANPGQLQALTNAITNQIVGTYKITYTATDQTGNSSNLERTINIVDSSKPYLVSATFDPQVMNKDQTTSQVTFVFSQEVQGFGLDDVTVDNGNGTFSNLQTSDNITFTAIFTANDNVNSSSNTLTIKNTYSSVNGNSPEQDQANQGQYEIYTAGPEVSAINASSGDGAANDRTFKSGDQITFRVTFTDYVQLIGTLTFNLNSGDSFTIPSFNNLPEGSPTHTEVVYTVGSGSASPLDVSGVDLSGTILDAYGNSVPLSDSGSFLQPTQTSLRSLNITIDNTGYSIVIPDVDDNGQDEGNRKVISQTQAASFGAVPDGLGNDPGVDYNVLINGVISNDSLDHVNFNDYYVLATLGSTDLGPTTIVYTFYYPQGSEVASVSVTRYLTIVEDGGDGGDDTISLVIETDSSSLSGHVVNKLSWKFTDIANNASQNLLSTSYQKTSGMFTTYIANGGALQLSSPTFTQITPAFAFLYPNVTYFSAGSTAASFLTSDGSDVVDGAGALNNNYNDIKLIVFSTGVALSNDINYQVAQLTFTTGSNGAFTLEYGSSSSNDYRTINLVVQNGEVSIE